MLEDTTKDATGKNAYDTAITATIVCPHCGFSKEMPEYRVPPSGTPGSCPNCAQMFYVSSETVLLEQKPTETMQDTSTKSSFIADVSFNTFTKKDNRFRGNGTIRIDNDRLTITGRRNKLFSGKPITESYLLASVRNVVRNGKTISFVIPLAKGHWQALLTCRDLASAERLVSILPLQSDSNYFNAEQANQEFKEKIAQLPQAAPVAWSLLAINILLYLLVAYTGKSWFSFSPDYLISMGGNFSALTTEGQWWRMLSATFLHGGLIHVAFNMYALYSFGIMAERLFGSRAFLGIYLLSGLAGSAGTLLFSPTAVGVGASGAIFGIMGALIAFLSTDKSFLSEGARKQILTSFMIYGSYSLMQGFRHTGIDNAAHIAGLLAGLCLGWLTGEPLRLRRGESSWFTSKVKAGILVVLLATGTAAASAPRLGSDYKAHLAMLEIVRDLGVKENSFRGYAKSKSAAAASQQTTGDDMLRELAQKMQATYAGFPERLEALHPASQGLKHRKQLLLTYLHYKTDAAELFLKAVEKQDKTFGDEAAKKLKEGNEVIKGLNKSFEWYR